MNEYPSKLPRNDEGFLEAYAWPGGYPIVYLDKNDETLCAKCANEAPGTPDDNDLAPVSFFVKEDSEEEVMCADCNQFIE